MSRRLPVLPPGDEILVAAVDAACADAARRAGARLACRIGCTECCIGPFPITALDAARLASGLVALRRSDPARADAVRERARLAAAEMSDGFPDDASRGALSADESARDTFFANHSTLPCPALDPASGACDLYSHRPISCRTFGPPMRIEGEDLPPCRLCFTDATSADVEAARGRLECHDLEEPLERALEEAGGAETVVAFALLG